MEIHKPKAAHSVREFLTEIGTIVCGILIALVLEQAVEALHSSHLDEQAEHAMRFELLDDDGPQVYARLAIAPCLSRQIDELRTAIEKRVPPEAFGKLAASYRPPRRTWDDQAWKAAQSSGVLSNIGPAKLDLWSRAYQEIPALAATNAVERDAVAHLKRSRFRSGELSQPRADELSDVVDDLRAANDRMTAEAAQQSVNMKISGLELPAAVRDSVLAEARTSYGECAVKPDLRAIEASQGQLETDAQDDAISKQLMRR